MGTRLQALPKRKSAAQSWSRACAFASMRPWKGGMAELREQRQRMVIGVREWGKGKGRKETDGKPPMKAKNCKSDEFLFLSRVDNRNKC